MKLFLFLVFSLQLWAGETKQSLMKTTAPIVGAKKCGSLFVFQGGALWYSYDALQAGGFTHAVPVLVTGFIPEPGKAEIVEIANSAESRVAVAEGLKRRIYVTAEEAKKLRACLAGEVKRKK